jgi:hypothetical protein
VKNAARLVLIVPMFLAGCRQDHAVRNVPPADPTVKTLYQADDPAELFAEPSLFEPGLIAGEQGVLDNWEANTKYFIDIRISDDLARVQGSQWLRYTNTELEPLEEIYFRLFPNIMSGEMTVSALAVNGVPAEPAFELAGSAMRVDLEEALLPGGSVEMEMDFTVGIPLEMSGNYGLFGYFEDILVLQEFYPLIPVFDEEGWNIEIPPKHGDVVFTDPGYYIVRVSAPQPQVLVTSGVPLASGMDGTRQQLLFAAGPVRDVYIASSSEFEKASRHFEDVTVNSYASKEHLEGAGLVLEHAIAALEVYDLRFGPYPYTELDLVSTPMLARGMEYPGVIANSKELYDLDGSPHGLPNPVLLESVTAHEVAHQWFFNTIGSDQLDEPWLDEAMAQYATGLYYLDRYGPAAYDGFRESWLERWDRVAREDIPVGLPAADYTGKEYGAIVYGRGPLFIEQLAQAMGTENFDEFLSSYTRDFRWGIASGEDFQALAEQECGCDLSPIFEEWVY